MENTPTVTSEQFCSRCGGVATAADSPEHAGCRAALELEPPRYCGQCGRRMVVQISPTGWQASCSRHGEFTSG